MLPSVRWTARAKLTFHTIPLCIIVGCSYSINVVFLIDTLVEALGAETIDRLEEGEVANRLIVMEEGVVLEEEEEALVEEEEEEEVWTGGESENLCHVKCGL